MDMEEILKPRYTKEKALEMIRKGWKKISKRRFGEICASLGMISALEVAFRYRSSPHVRYRLSMGNTYYALRIFKNKKEYENGRVFIKLDQPPYGDTTYEGLKKLREYLNIK